MKRWARRWRTCPSQTVDACPSLERIVCCMRDRRPRMSSGLPQRLDVGVAVSLYGGSIIAALVAAARAHACRLNSILLSRFSLQTHTTPARLEIPIIKSNACPCMQNTAHTIFHICNYKTRCLDSPPSPFWASFRP